MTSTVFKKIDYTLGGLIESIKHGSIGLPDIQRPFVWKDAKVRNLFDSMYRGYPVGYLLFWENGVSDAGKIIGVEKKQVVPQLLIVDGQQRLTSLYAVMRGVEVLREDYSSGRIQIAFNPLTEQFDVADAAIRNDRSYLPDVSVCWTEGADLFQIVDDFILRFESERPLERQERQKVQSAIVRLKNLTSFPFTVMVLSSEINEEQVSEVFVRINSEGKKLNQADFILTLMSVFWDEGRAMLEHFCKESRAPSKGASPFNYIVEPDPDQLLRVCVGLGFRRARLQNVYSLLRGKNLDTGEFSIGQRDIQFSALRSAQSKVLSLSHWHEFLKCISDAGFRSSKLISSKNNLIYSYLLYLIGRCDLGVKDQDLRRLVGQWFFMCQLTGRYTNSPESRMEFDLAQLRSVSNASEFGSFVERTCDSALTNDFWQVSLPNELATASANSPSMFAYFAALTRLEARALFSNRLVSDLLDPSVKSTRSALERHHLFPKAYLRDALKITEPRDVNQIANFTLIEWGDNGAISQIAPSVYYPQLMERVDSLARAPMVEAHALPDGWMELPYAEFLKQRRELMARVIHSGYERVLGNLRPQSTSLPGVEHIAEGEGSQIEFKATLRTNLHTMQKDARMELAVLKTIAGFMNSRGGTLYIGVGDDGEPVDLSVDGFSSKDDMHLHLSNLTKDKLNPAAMLYLHPKFDEVSGNEVLVVRCQPAKSPIYLRDGPVDKFFVRNGAATAELAISAAHQYIAGRFG